MDESGLDEMDQPHSWPSTIEKFKGGPVGISTIATAVSEQAGTIEEVHEPFLITEGYIQRTPWRKGKPPLKHINTLEKKLRLEQRGLFSVNSHNISIFCLDSFSDFILFYNNFGSGNTVKVYTFYIKGRTATGQHTTKIKQPFVAISRDLLQKISLKSKIQLSDCHWSGVYAVLIMGSKHNHAVDIYYKGRKRNVMKCSCSRVNMRQFKNYWEHSNSGNKTTRNKNKINQYERNNPLYISVVLLQVVLHLLNKTKQNRMGV